MSVQESTTGKSKKVKKVVEEPECCPICMENYTPIIRKKCACKYCKADTCSKCIERYLLDKHEDAHCLHCRVNYNDTALQEICTKTYLQHVYFKHRQEVLINRERANLPGLQDAALEQRKLRDKKDKVSELSIQYAAIKAQRDEVMSGYNKLYTEYYARLSAKQDTSELRKQLDAILARSDEFKGEMDKLAIQINNVRYAPTAVREGAGGAAAAEQKKEEEKKKFIRRCTRDGCQGFLSTAWKCGICEYYSCSKCFKTKTKERDDPHECTKEDLETAKLILADCKPCPNCGEFIMKSSGCFGKDTPILLWNGKTKMSQDICIGDELVGDDGAKRTVLDTTTGVDTLYKVKQNGGLSYVVNSKHTLVLKYSGEKHIYWSDTYKYWGMNWFDREKYINKSHTIKISWNKTKEQAFNEMEKFKNTLNFEEEIQIMVDDYMKLGKSVKNTLVGFKSEGINWEKQDVLLDPYLMGVYLGDGVNDGISFAINPNNDPEILEYLLKWCNNNSCEVVHDEAYRFRVRRRDNKQNVQKAIGKGATIETCKGCKQKVCYLCDLPNTEYTTTTIKARKNPLKSALESYNLVRNKKRIPFEYLINDRETRLKLLAGIIDTDGHLTKAQKGKRIMIVSANKEFAEQIVLLARSLSFATTIRAVSKKGIAFKKGGEKKDYNDHYQINISGNICDIPTLIERKKCVNSNPSRDLLRTSIEVSEIGIGEYFGWKVDSNSKFLLNDMTCLRNCSQMWCITCQTPWDWNTGKVVTTGAIHNPHYYEWMKRNGQAMPRNPADVPCGGYPNAWELRRMPKGLSAATANLFFEFHRICQELQDISTRAYRAHIDNTVVADINVKFLLGDYDEKHWGQLLGKNERKRKRDSEVQEIFAAFRMVAVELINRVQNYREGGIRSFTDLPAPNAEKFLEALYVEIEGLITMINDALRSCSISHNYSVPYIHKEGAYYSIKTKNFSDEAKKKRGSKKEKEEGGAAGGGWDDDRENEVVEPVAPVAAPIAPVIESQGAAGGSSMTIKRRKKPQVAPVATESDEDDAGLQAAIQASLGI
jgi:hypothetical protein